MGKILHNLVTLLKLKTEKPKQIICRKLRHYKQKQKKALKFKSYKTLVKIKLTFSKKYMAINVCMKTRQSLKNHFFKKQMLKTTKAMLLIQLLERN